MRYFTTFCTETDHQYPVYAVYPLWTTRGYQSSYFMNDSTNSLAKK